MRRLVSLAALVALGGVLGAVPAAANIDSNPNAIEFGPAVCEDGKSFEAIYTPTDPSFVGQDADSNVVGVAKAIWLADEAGNKVALLTRPINPALEALTVFCWWPVPDAPTGFVGGDILFSGIAR